MSSDGFYDLAADYDALGDELVGRIPVGDHNATVVAARSRTSASGKGQIGLTLEIDEGPEAGTKVDDLLTWSPESEVARRIMSSALAMMGATSDWIKENRANMADVAERVTGARVAIRVKEGEFNGMPQARVSYIRSLGFSQAAQAPEAPTLGTAPAAPQQAAQPPANAPQPQQPQQGAWPTL